MDRDELPSLIELRDDLDEVDWQALKADLAADNFDNGRTADELRLSCLNSHANVFAWNGSRVVGMGRIMSDRICNSYMVDVWTQSTYRGRGIASGIVRQLLDTVPGQHVILQTDEAEGFYRKLGFRERSGCMEIVVGRWLNRDDRPA